MKGGFLARLISAAASSFIFFFFFLFQLGGDVGARITPPSRFSLCTRGCWLVLLPGSEGQIGEVKDDGRVGGGAGR